MGIVVSAVATGLLHNIACSKEAGSTEDKREVTTVETGVGTEADTIRGQADSPQRIRTPGYPQIVISPPPGHDSGSRVNKEVSSEAGIPPSRLYPPLAGKPSSSAQIVRTAPVIKHQQTLNNSSIENNGMKLDYESAAQNDVNKENEAVSENKMDGRLFQGNETSLLVGDSKKKLLPIEKLSESELLGQLSTLSGVSPLSLPSLPIVSLLPTLTEEITLTLERSGMTGPHPGWFRRNYTSIDTVQKIYGTHPRYLRDSGLGRRPQTCAGGSAGHVRPSKNVRCDTSMSHGRCHRGNVTARRATVSLASSPAKSNERGSKFVGGNIRSDAKSAERRKYFAKTGSISLVSSPTKEKEITSKKEIVAPVDS